MFLQDIREITPEVTVGHSRLDFVVSDSSGLRTGIEVKGCTFVRNHIALFPDAPTKRGVRHLQTLMQMRKNGEKAILIILIFGPNPHEFCPNHLTDPKFTETFWDAVDCGVEIFPLLLRYQGTSIQYLQRIKLCKKVNQI